MDVLLEVLSGSKHDLDLFTSDEIDWLQQRVFNKTSRGKVRPHVSCIVRNKDIQLRPEEIVRQLYARRLIELYGYEIKRIAFEFPVSFGVQKKKADIVVLENNRPKVPYIIVELKKPRLKSGKDQLRSYCHATGAPIGVWTNGGQISCYNRKDPNHFEEIPDIPNVHQSLKDIVSERFTLRDLIIKDKIANEQKSLKDIILEMEDEVFANTGDDVFEEVFKLIFTKLYDELESQKDMANIEFYVSQVLDHDARSDYDKVRECLLGLDDRGQFRVLEFRNTGESDTELKQKMQRLFEKAKEKWDGVFSEDAAFGLTESHLSICVSSLQDIKLLNSNLLVVDEAFEYLVSKSAKAEKGQFFTPRHVIDMCVQMLNPRRGEYMIDTASGSCGFPVHTIFKITGHLFTNADIMDRDREDILRVFGIDIDPRVVRVARTLNLIAGDGETNVLELNTLDYTQWGDKTEDQQWRDVYGNGFKRLSKLRKGKGQNKSFSFDVLMANPPFAGPIKEPRLLHQYELAFNAKGKPKSEVGRDILFIERNLDFLKPGGRMAIVLPQGRLNNSGDKSIRDFIVERARIVAVVGLHVNTFKPHTGTKTSVLFVQKWDDEKCPYVDDYPIFLAVSENGGKDSSGEYIYAKGENGQHRLDKNGHLIVDHDLHNHDGELPNGIAEAFIEWAKCEELSFWVE